MIFFSFFLSKLFTNNRDSHPLLSSWPICTRALDSVQVLWEAVLPMKGWGQHFTPGERTAVPKVRYLCFLRGARPKAQHFPLYFLVTWPDICLLGMLMCMGSVFSCPTALVGPFSHELAKPGTVCEELEGPSQACVSGHPQMRAIFLMGWDMGTQHPPAPPTVLLLGGNLHDQTRRAPRRPLSCRAKDQSCNW